MQPTNPYRAAMLLIGVLPFVVGLALLVLGQEPGVGAVGVDLVAFSVVPILLWVLISALQWTAAAPSDTEPAQKATKAPAPEGSLLETIRRELGE